MKAYIKDCDPFGSVYYSRYLEWAEMSRVDMFKADFDKLVEQGNTMIPCEVSVKYKRPLKMFDEFNMGTVLVSKTSASADLLTAFIKDEIIYCEVLVKMVCINTTTGKPTRHGL